MPYNYRPVILIVLDGWGLSPEYDGNAIAQSNTPNFNKLTEDYPFTALQAASIAVGLSWGEMGNSEVGHTIIGAGKIIYQNFSRVTMAIQDGSLFSNKTLLAAIKHAKDNNSNLHLMGLASTGGVHSHMDHIYALLEMAKRERFDRVYLHLFTDGRDTPPTEGVQFIQNIQNQAREVGVGQIASIIGRYWAMDRNNNWDRIQKAYDAIVYGMGRHEQDALIAMEDFYKKQVTDEFMEPIIITQKDSEIPLATIADNDSIIFFNFREDRARQLTAAFILDDFDKVNRSQKLNNLFFATMVEYQKGLPAQVVFPPEAIVNPLGKVLSDNGMRQLHIAETEKYAHVTYFFNGGAEEPFPGEKDILVPSPAVSRFDEAPEMSAYTITERVIEELATLKYDFILINFANPDMVGHTGNMDAIKKAIETVDDCVGQIVKEMKKYDGAVLITADHGNAETKLNLQTGEALTEHTTNPVPLWLIAKDFTCKSDYSRETKNTNPQNITVQGLLSDVAPTVLELLGLEKPVEMSGQSLVTIISQQIR